MLNINRTALDIPGGAVGAGAWGYWWGDCFLQIRRQSYRHFVARVAFWEVDNIRQNLISTYGVVGDSVRSFISNSKCAQQLITHKISRDLCACIM